MSLVPSKPPSLGAGVCVLSALYRVRGADRSAPNVWPAVVA